MRSWVPAENNASAGKQVGGWESQVQFEPYIKYSFKIRISILLYTLPMLATFSPEHPKVAPSYRRQLPEGHLPVKLGVQS